MERANVKTLELIHPVHGVVMSWSFVLLNRCHDTGGVLKVVNRWRMMYGKKFLECETTWKHENI